MHEQFRCPHSSPIPRGVHHLALCTDDMKATIDFYIDVLGMPLVHAMKVPPGLGTGSGNRGNPPYERVRHYFFDMGNDSLLAFFGSRKARNPPATAMRSVPCSIALSSSRPSASARSRRGWHRAVSTILGRSHSSRDCSASIFMTLTVSASNLLASQTTARRPRWSRASCRPGRRRARHSPPCPASRLSGSKSASPPCQTDRADPHAAPISHVSERSAPSHKMLLLEIEGAVVMSAIELYNAPQSTCSQKVRLTRAEKGSVIQGASRLELFAGDHRILQAQSKRGRADID